MVHTRSEPRVKPKRVAPTVTQGVHGTIITGGFIQSDEKDATLRGQRKYKEFSDLLANVNVMATGVRFFLNLISKAKWRVVPPKDSGEAGEQIASTIDDMMHDMETPWHRIVRRMAMFKFYGFAVGEWTAKLREDGNIGYADIGTRPQRTIEQWDVEDDGKVRGFIQRSPQTFAEIYLSRDRTIYMVDDSLDDSPEGMGLFRHLVENGRRLRRYLQLEGFGYENDLRGIPIARAPLMELAKAVTAKEITQEQADDLTKPLEEFIDAHAKNPQLGMMLDSVTWQSQGEDQKPTGTPQWSLELLDGGTYSLEEIAAAIIRINLEIARLLGIEHLLLGADGTGSLALAKDKSDNFALCVDSAMREIRETFNRDFLKPLFILNGWDMALMPKFETEQITNRDITRIGEALTSLSDAGIVLSRQDDLVTEFLELIGFSPLLPLEEVDPDMAAANRVSSGLEQTADSKAASEAPTLEPQVTEA